MFFDNNTLRQDNGFGYDENIDINITNTNTNFNDNMNDNMNMNMNTFNSPYSMNMGDNMTTMGTVQGPIIEPGRERIVQRNIIHEVKQYIPLLNNNFS